jgi:glycerol-3-phosphate acyltransferase PlsY
VAVLAISGCLGLSTILAALSLVPATLWLGAPAPVVGFGVVLAAFIVFTHRSNIRKMRDGSEHRFERVRARNWFRRTG